ncbi:hypothetical protein O181_028298, partial [Austropuccinia psidii MF-1]|nr:hypothetical protein [Austropuccinia psidii MF-1]
MLISMLMLMLHTAHCTLPPHQSSDFRRSIQILVVSHRLRPFRPFCAIDNLPNSIGYLKLKIDFVGRRSCATYSSCSCLLIVSSLESRSRDPSAVIGSINIRQLKRVCAGPSSLPHHSPNPLFRRAISQKLVISSAVFYTICVLISLTLVILAIIIFLLIESRRLDRQLVQAFRTARGTQSSHPHRPSQLPQPPPPPSILRHAPTHPASSFPSVSYLGFPTH